MYLQAFLLFVSKNFAYRGIGVVDDESFDDLFPSSSKLRLKVTQNIKLKFILKRI